MNSQNHIFELVNLIRDFNALMVRAERFLKSVPGFKGAAGFTEADGVVISVVMDAVCEKLNIKAADIIRKDKHFCFSDGRQMAILLSAELAGFQPWQMAGAFKRKQCSILYSLRVARERVETDLKFKATYLSLKQEIETKLKG